MYSCVSVKAGYTFTVLCWLLSPTVARWIPVYLITLMVKVLLIIRIGLIRKLRKVTADHIFAWVLCRFLLRLCLLQWPMHSLATLL